MMSPYLDKNHAVCDMTSAVETTTSKKESTNVMMQCYMNWMCYNPVDFEKRSIGKWNEQLMVKRGSGIAWNDALTDELHKPLRRKFKNRRVFVSGVDAIWTADLVDMQSFSKNNEGYKYIFMTIDVFSKYGWAFPLKTKTGSEVTKAFQDMWKTQTSTQKLWTDKGKEFCNRPIKYLLDKSNVQLYSTENVRGGKIEPYNQTSDVEILYSKQHNELHQCTTRDCK